MQGSTVAWPSIYFGDNSCSYNTYLRRQCIAFVYSVVCLNKVECAGNESV
jgi:hypothetical protein